MDIFMNNKILALLIAVLLVLIGVVIIRLYTEQYDAVRQALIQIIRSLFR